MTTTETTAETTAETRIDGVTRVTIDARAGALVDALESIASALRSAMRTVLPILRCVRLSVTTDDELSLVATDLDTAATLTPPHYLVSVRELSDADGKLVDDQTRAAWRAVLPLRELTQILKSYGRATQLTLTLDAQRDKLGYVYYSARIVAQNASRMYGFITDTLDAPYDVAEYPLVAPSETFTDETFKADDGTAFERLRGELAPVAAGDDARAFVAGLRALARGAARDDEARAIYTYACIAPAARGKRPAVVQLITADHFRLNVFAPRLMAQPFDPPYELVSGPYSAPTNVTTMERLAAQHSELERLAVRNVTASQSKTTGKPTKAQQAKYARVRESARCEHALKRPYALVNAQALARVASELDVLQTIYWRLTPRGVELWQVGESDDPLDDTRDALDRRIRERRRFELQRYDAPVSAYPKWEQVFKPDTAYMQRAKLTRAFTLGVSAGMLDDYLKRVCALKASIVYIEWSAAAGGVLTLTCDVEDETHEHGATRTLRAVLPLITARCTRHYPPDDETHALSETIDDFCGSSERHIYNPAYLRDALVTLTRGGKPALYDVAVLELREERSGYLGSDDGVYHVEGTVKPFAPAVVYVTPQSRDETLTTREPWELDANDDDETTRRAVAQRFATMIMPMHNTR